jgi:ribosome-associated translation inhibitor RaiA
MKLPLQITFRDLVPLPSLEEQIRSRAAKLEQLVPDLVSCHVVVEATGNRHHQGHRYVVKIDARVPGEEVFTGQRHGGDEIDIVVPRAFDAATRRLEDYARRRRDLARQHAPEGAGDLAQELSPMASRGGAAPHAVPPVSG